VASLTKTRRMAGLLLVGAAVVFLALRIGGLDDGVWGYVSAGAEAAMVGGLADWFAVTALFRYPLGIPLPHTAIIPTRKDEIGRALGSFVEENFLDPAIIGERVAGAHLTQRAAQWAAHPEHGARVADHTVAALVGALRSLSDDEFGGEVGRLIIERLEQLDVATLASHVVSSAIADRRHEPIVDAALVASRRWLADHQRDLRSRFGRESPWWVPESIDDKMFTKLHTGLVGFLDEVIRDPRHELRAELVHRAQALANALASSPSTRTRVEQWRDEWLASPEVAQWASGIWADVRRTLIDQADQAGRPLHRRVEGLVQRGAQRLSSDAELRAKLDARLTTVAGEVALRAQGHVGEFIASTVARWDPIETSDRIETQIGADLQYIRINGTLVGALIGIALHGLGQLLG
jgi:uncharacterized membrane-anchored protein YjiN (DUF445 family)